MRSDELDEDQNPITAQNKETRDSRTFEYVQDNIIDPFNYTPTYKYNECKAETSWCTTGAMSNLIGWDDDTSSCDYWANYTDSGKYPLIVIMNNSTGQLWQYSLTPGRQYFLDENDKCYGHMASSSECMEFLQKEFFKKYPSSRALLDYITENEKSDKMKILFESAPTTPNGYLIVSDRSDLEKYLTIINKFNGIFIASNTAVEMFKDLQCNRLPPIDCNAVHDAQGMFMETKCPLIELKNTHNIVNMKDMFRKSKIN